MESADGVRNQQLIVVTGASGFIGTELVRHLIARGYRVRALVRSGERMRNALNEGERGAVEVLTWELGAPLPANAFEGTPVALVHLAFETRGGASRVLSINERATRELVGAARAAGNVFSVYLSSFSAGAAADAGLLRHSAYARAKRESEALFDPECDLILRPGLVMGGGDGGNGKNEGLFGRFKALLARGVWIPLFYGGLSPVQWIQVDELISTLSQAIEKRQTGLYHVASEQAVTLREWVQIVALSIGVKARAWVVPHLISDLLAMSLRIFEKLGGRFGIQLPITSDTIYGVKYAQVVKTQQDLKKLGLIVAGLDPTQTEALILAHYLLPELERAAAGSPELLQRIATLYSRALSARGMSPLLGFAIAHGKLSHWSLSAWEGFLAPAERRVVVRDHLLLMSAILESQPELARFYLPVHRTAPSTFATLVAAACGIVLSNILALRLREPPDGA